MPEDKIPSPFHLDGERVLLDAARVRVLSSSASFGDDPSAYLFVEGAAPWIEVDPARTRFELQAYPVGGDASAVHLRTYGARYSLDPDVLPLAYPIEVAEWILSESVQAILFFEGDNVRPDELRLAYAELFVRYGLRRFVGMISEWTPPEVARREVLE